MEDKTSSNTGNFYKSIGDAELALIGCYNGWKRTNSDDTWGFYMCSELAADECFAGTGTGDSPNYSIIDRFDMSRYATGVNLLESSWKSYYATSYRCNELIKYDLSGQIVWGENNNLRGKVMGECRMIRALCYFDMVRMWENIPLVTEPVNDDFPQADPDDVYSLIVEDLKFAIDNISSDAYPKAHASPHDVRIPQHSVEGITARVYFC